MEDVDLSTLSREEVLARALLHIEAEVNRKGWDEQPQLHALCGPGSEPNGWKLEALMASPLFYVMHHPRRVLRNYADMLVMPGLTGQAAINREFVINGLAMGN